MVKMFDISKNELFDNARDKSVFKTIQIVYPNNIDSI